MLQLEKAQVRYADGREATRLRDGLNWDAIAAAHGSRNSVQCYEKWYTDLCGADAAEEHEVWGIEQDSRLLRALWQAKPHFVRSPPPRF